MNLDFDVLDSTNDYLKRNYKDLNDLTFVSCKIQNSGKGRNGRRWYADDNNLLFSLLIKDKYLISKYKNISILMAYSIIEVLKDYGLNDLKIKWPNDIYNDDKKICGILLEAISTNDIECLIVGVGLNVNQNEFNDEYLITPTSIKKIINKDIDIDELKDKVYSKILNILNNIDLNYYEEINKLDYLKNKEVYCKINNVKQKVKVIGIDLDYSLKIDIDNKISNILAGEISFHI